MLELSWGYKSLIINFGVIPQQELGHFGKCLNVLQGNNVVCIAEIILLPSIIIIVLHSRQHQSINLTSDPRLRDEDPRVHGNPKKKNMQGSAKMGVSR